MTWIPCSERLPDDDLTVLVFVPEAPDEVWLGYLVADEWHWESGYPCDPAPTHWMPLPDPPEKPDGQNID